MIVHNFTHLKVLVTNDSLELNLARVLVDPCEQFIFVTQNSIHNHSRQIQLKRQTLLQFLQSVLFRDHKKILPSWVSLHHRWVNLLNWVLISSTYSRSNSAHINPFKGRHFLRGKGLLQQRIYVDLLLCCVSFKPKFRVGHMLNFSLQSIWLNEMRQLLKLFLTSIYHQ